MQSACSTLSRAWHHLTNLSSEIHAYRGRDPIDFTYRQRNDPQDDTRLIVECVAWVNEEPPTERGLIVGDILPNLRAALGHGFFGYLTSRHTLPEEQAQSIQFPLHVEKSKWASWLKQYPQWVVPAVADCIGAAQPFTIKGARGSPALGPPPAGEARQAPDPPCRTPGGRSPSASIRRRSGT